MSWHALPVPLADLNLDTTLRCGQSFRWRKATDSSTWSCGLWGRLISLRQTEEAIYWRAIHPTLRESHNEIGRKPEKRRFSRDGQDSRTPLNPPRLRALPLLPSPSVKSELDPSDHKLAIKTESSLPCTLEDTSSLLHQYLNLSPDLSSLYRQWSASDPVFKRTAPRFTGLRMLHQPAWEALVGFICSSNNNIARISQMMEKLCVEYGDYIAASPEDPAQVFYGLPGPERLAKPGTEARLRELGFGYRAGYIVRTAEIISKRGLEWLDGLSNLDKGKASQGHPERKEWSVGGREGYRAAHEALLELQGVGPKVADCVCLMGLGWGEAVPVDTHVWQIAQRDYKFGKGKFKSLTKATYEAVGNHFRGLWGIEAGWSHSVLFAADLRAFKENVKEKVEVKEEIVKDEEGSNEKVETKVVVKEVPQRGIKRELEEIKKESGIIERQTKRRITRKGR